METNMDDLSKEDWQWIFYACQERWKRADPKPSEPPASKAYKDERDRIFKYVCAKAYPKA